MRESRAKQAGIKDESIAMGQRASIAIFGVAALLASCSSRTDLPEQVATTRSAASESTPLGTPRARHTATLLADGNVLVAGGGQLTGSLVPIARAELYQSFAGGFAPLPHMNSARYGHTATRLFDGSVLVAGGFGQAGAGLSAAELYEPDTQTFVSVGEMQAQRGAHTATLLEDGRVLILGGTSADDGGSAVSGAEVYDPDTRTFGDLANAPLYPAARNVAVSLADSKVLILWSESRLLELFDPATNSFSAAPPAIGGLPGDLGQIVSATRLGDDSLAIFGTNRLWRTGASAACKYGQVLCDGECVDQHFDDGHCGACGTICGPDQLCVDGTCTCIAPYTACGADCVVLGSDNDDHCGACFNACPGDSFCNIGMNCICDFGCGPNCTPPFDDPQNCGTCGNVCAPGYFCSAGQCRSDCVPPQIKCGSSCVDTNTDEENCGGCGITCPTSCVSGFCAPQCGPNQAACFFGIELGCANILTDSQHCGGCNLACGPGRECWEGHCWLASGSTDLLANRSAVVTRSADAVWMTQDSAASVLREEDAEAWTAGLQADPDEMEVFGGVGHTTTALPDGSILTVGGLDTPSAMRVQSPWRIEELKLKPGDLQFAMSLTSAQLPNGHVLYALGSDLFDYDGLALTALGSVDNGGTTMALVPQASGRVLVVGGMESRGTSWSSTIAAPVAHLFDPKTGTAAELDLALHDFGRVLTLPDGALLLGGLSGLDLIRPMEGEQFQLDSVTAELGCYDPWLGRLPNGRVLVVGDNAFRQLDLDTLALSDGVDSLLSRCASTSVVRPDGTVLVMGGWNASSEVFSTAWELYDSKAGTTVPVQSPTENIVAWSMQSWFDGPLFFTHGPTSSSVRQLNWGSASFDYAVFVSDFPLYDTTGPFARQTRLMPDATIVVENGWSSELDGGIRMARMSMGLPAPRARFDFQDAPLLHMNDVLDFSATFPDAKFPGHSPEGSSGTTASSSSALPVPVWFPSDGYPALGALTRVGTEVKLRVPKTPFPGLGLMFLAENGKLTGIGPVAIAPSANGTECVNSAECDSGHCVDGVCCNEACDGTCEACSKASHAAEDGVCGPAAAGTLDAACNVSPIETCGTDGTCDGQGSCAFYPDGTECIDGAVCTDGDCIKVPDEPMADTCNEDSDVVNAAGQVTECHEYRCRKGACLEGCSSNRDCKGGFACTADGTCEPPLDQTRVVSCGCRLPLERRPGLEHGLAGLLALAAAMRRMRFSRSDGKRLSP